MWDSIRKYFNDIWWDIVQWERPMLAAHLIATSFVFWVLGAGFGFGLARDNVYVIGMSLLGLGIASGIQMFTIWAGCRE